jgi:hypothetical protein
MYHLTAYYLRGAYFDGANSHMEVVGKDVEAAPVVVSAAFTVELWVRPRETERGWLFADGSTGFRLELTTGSVVHLLTSAGTVTGGTIASDWTSVALVIEPDNAEILLNGVSTVQAS